MSGDTICEHHGTQSVVSVSKIVRFLMTNDLAIPKLVKNAIYNPNLTLDEWVICLPDEEQLEISTHGLAGHFVCNLCFSRWIEKHNTSIFDPSSC